jgi:hypothetical protein
MSKSIEANSFALDLDIKAFKGKGAFRILLHNQAAIVRNVQTEMKALSDEIEGMELPMQLMYSEDQRTTHMARARLRWRIRGEMSTKSFDKVRPLLNQIPVGLHDYLEKMNDRAQELNALEAIFRYAAAQTSTYLSCGTVKIVRSVQSVNQRVVD